MKPVLSIWSPLVALFAAAIAFATPISEHGKLSVGADGIIKDRNNADYVLRGMSLYWYNGPWGGGQPGNQFYTQSVVNDLANAWKVNMVRAAIGDKNVAVAKNMMDWAYSAGIYVIIDNHSHGAHNETSAVQNFFSEVSQYVKQKGYTHVIYEIYNEPVCNDGSTNNNCVKTTWSQIKTFANSVISTIRNNDADGIIVVGTPGYSSDVASPKRDPITGKNIMYTLHFYAGTSGHSNYRESLKAAYCDSLPVFVTEWGTCESTGNGAVNTNNSNTWLSLLEAAKVSSANWSVVNLSESCSALTGTSLTNGFTTSGNYVKNVISKLNSGGTLSSAGLSETSINCSSGGGTVIERDGKIYIDAASPAVNYLSKNGADSAEYSPLWTLRNTANNFTASYNLSNIEKNGKYLLKFYYGSTADASISWSGTAISSGSQTLKSTGTMDKKTIQTKSETVVLDVNENPETPFNISVQAGAAGSFALLYILVSMADSADSVKFNIPNTPSPILKNGGDLNFSNQNFKVYDLRGKFIGFAESADLKSAKFPQGIYIIKPAVSNSAPAKKVYVR